MLEGDKQAAVVKVKMTKSQRDTWLWVWQVVKTLNEPFSQYGAVLLLLFVHSQADVTLNVFYVLHIWKKR